LKSCDGADDVAAPSDLDGAEGRNSLHVEFVATYASSKFIISVVIGAKFCDAMTPSFK
jgi:hypothetical protein